ncbi:hypothetical protein DXG01_006721 [Tephrocybe rancida]|nr:hypothetical protein DXG01_006721 [Tephrocybe rancida]
MARSSRDKARDKIVYGRRLTRSERAKIRILYQYGNSKAKIRGLIPCGSLAVTHVLSKITGRFDEGDEWDAVDEEFRKEYPPLQTVSNLHFCRLGSVLTLGQGENRDVVVAAAAPQSDKNEVVDSLQADTEGEDSKEDFIELDTPEPSLKVLPELDVFLQSLEHDLSEFRDLLEAQGLGSTEKLFAFVSWSEEQLHVMFEETFPQLTVPQRFMLVNGLKMYI